jgi:WD40 repeat protein/tRNA A-37 threonylcarbamoyl transferase component Bud32
MSDATRDGTVTATANGDPEATIDAAQPAPVSTVRVVPAEAAPDADYPELVEVERRHYAIVRELAKGGVGRVLEARDLRLGRQVAIKELLPKNRDTARRFEREARITARLQHPAIIHVYEAGMWPGGEPFIAMALVPGRSLDKVVAEKATLVERLALVPNVIAVADALAYAHSENVIHRDLKPGNVLVGEFGQTVVIDWGLAKDLGETITESKQSVAMRLRASSDETLSGGVVGTPAYMPPEQARGEAVDQRADVYAIGALLYKVLTGIAPYTGESSRQVLELVKLLPPVLVDEREPGAPPELVAIVAKAMAREPNDRYRSAGELARDLQRFQTGQLVAAHRYTTGQLVWRFLRRHRLPFAVGAVALAALAVVGVVSVRRVLAEKARTEAKRYALLEERGRTELLADRAGPALVYLVAAARDRNPDGALAFLLAEAMRPFQAEQAPLRVGAGSAIVAASSDGARLAIGTEKLMWIEAGRVGELQGIRRCRALAFDASGRQLAAGDDDGVARVWSDGSPSPLVLAGHAGPVLDVAFSADSHRLVTASSDGTARVWELPGGRPLAISHCHASSVTSARFDPSGGRIATASEDGSACVWSVEGDALITPLRGHTGPVRSARWSPDGKRVVTASDDGTAYVWNADLGKPVVQPLKHAKAVVAAELAPDGQRVLTASADHTAIVWELPEAIDRAASPVGGASGGAQVPAGDAPLPVARPVVRLVGHTDAIVAAAYDARGNRVATAGLDGIAKVWDAATGHAMASFEHANGVATLAFAGDRLVTGDHAGTVHIWDVTHSIAGDGHELKSPVHALAALPDGTIAAGTDDSRVTLVGPAGKRELWHLARVLAVAAEPGTLVSGGEDPQPIVWDVRTGAPRCRLGSHEVATRALATAAGVVAIALPDAIEVWATRDCRLLGRRVTSGTGLAAIAIRSDGALVVAGGEDGRVLVWDRAGEWAAPPRAIDARLGGAVRALALSPAGALLVGGDGAARIIDLQGNELATLDGPFGNVTAVAWLDDTLAVTANSEGLARVWDADKGKLLAVRGIPGAGVSAVAVAGSTLWTGGDDGRVRPWDVHVAPPGVDRDALAARTGWFLGDDDVARKDVARKAKDTDGTR